MKKSFFMWNLEILKKSLRALNINIIYEVILDILFFASLYLGIKGFELIFDKTMAQLQNLQLDTATKSLEQASAVLAGMKEIFFSAILILAMLALFFILAHSLFKGWVWHLALGKRYSIKSFLRFLLLNFAWQGSWIAVIAFSVSAVKQHLFYQFLSIMLLIMLHFSSLLYIRFVKDNKMNNIFSVFSYGIRKLPYFVFPYIIISIILSFFIWLNSMPFLQGNAGFIILIIIFLLYLAWSRHYLICIAEEI